MAKIGCLLIANRGEIAVRVIRSARDLGIKSVAVYSDTDRNAPFVNLADEAYSLGSGSFRDTYMNGDKIIEICQKANVDAIHPGYGFLSENSDFARKVIVNGIKWLGPSGDAIEALGDKVKARQVADKANVSPVPGLSEFIKSADVVKDFIKKYDYPVILKRADGGGGQGITVVTNESELNNFLTAHTHDLDAYFIERFVQKARHVETQCARDSFGNFCVVSTRDCSLQRRNQKLLEEAPAPFLNNEIEEQLFKWSKSLFETVDYVGLGTCEFLCETFWDKKDLANDKIPQAIYFLEVNPRLQVEHTVSEEVADVDLVEEQIRIAEGEKLSEQLLVNGGNLISCRMNDKHSFELRITSENPYQNMTPTGGIVTKLNWPMGPGVRLEPGIIQGDEVSTDFDSMVAKVIITGKNRAQVIARTKRALKELEIEGISSPKDLFNIILNSDEFTSNNQNNFTVYTKWLETSVLPNMKSDQKGATEQLANQKNGANEIQLEEFIIEIDSKRTVLKLPKSLINLGQNANIGFQSNAYWSNIAPTVAPRMSSLMRGAPKANVNPTDSVEVKNGEIPSPMQGIVVRAVVEVGQKINAGDLLVVLEAMKMEKFINSPISGSVKEICVNAGDSVNAGQILIKLQEEEG